MQKLDLPLKKQPLQQRSKFLVDCILEAATRVLKTEGVAGFTTNAVADEAGVSIGSLYQYFTSKETLLAEIKRSHFSELLSLFRQVPERLKTNQLSELISCFVDASVAGHEIDPTLHKILSHDVANFELEEKADLSATIHQKVAEAFSQYKGQIREGLDLNVAAQLLSTLVETTVHHTVLYQADKQKQQRTIAELKYLIMVYLTCGELSTE
ncbi:TetR/AcrR family transcriptional regulator [Thalassotalea ganghwensis]